MGKNKFGQMVRELREKAGLSQRALGDKVGVDFTYISKIESGAKPPPSKKVLIKLATILNIDEEKMMILTGKIPEDIAEMLRNPGVIRYLRSTGVKKIISSINNK